MTYKKFVEEYLTKGLLKKQKRNIFTYEIDIAISRTEAEGAFDTAVKFVTVIKDVIKEENPQEHFKF